MKLLQKTTKKTLSTALLLGLWSASAQESPTTFSIGLTSDQFFGFAPSLGLEYKLSDKIGVSTYGIFWSGGTGAGWGNWTEFGGGVNLTLAEGVVLNPNLGFTFGSLLSRGTDEAQLGGIAGDGIVPNLFFNVDIPKFESEVYVGYYAPLRDKSTPVSEGGYGSTLAYLHYWANAGYKVSPVFSFGAHFEHLRRTKDDTNGVADYYQWLGPYVQFNAGKYGAFVRLSAGTDFVDVGGDGITGSDSFYKLSTGFSF